MQHSVRIHHGQMIDVMPIHQPQRLSRGNRLQGRDRFQAADRATGIIQRPGLKNRSPNIAVRQQANKLPRHWSTGPAPRFRLCPSAQWLRQ